MLVHFRNSCWIRYQQKSKCQANDDTVDLVRIRENYIELAQIVALWKIALQSQSGSRVEAALESELL